MPLPLSAHNPCRTLCFILLSMCPLLAAAEILPEDGPASLGPETYPPDRPWQELASELPPWPEEDHLIELKVDGPYRVYIDERSVTTGSDRVVRFSSVLVSPSGVRNVTFEGLHCGKQKHRRIAYGANGSWHELPESGWLHLPHERSGDYRSLLYYRYMCSPTEPARDAEHILRKLRSVRPVIRIDD